MTKRTVQTVLALVTLAMTLACIAIGLYVIRRWAVFEAEAPLAELSSPRPKVTVEKVTSAAGTASLTFSGTVRAHRRAQLAFTLTGRLVERSAKVGQTVKKGAPLARLDRAPFQNAVAEAKAQVAHIDVSIEQTRRDVERQKRLVTAGAAMAEQLEQLQSKLSALRTRRAQAKVKVDESSRQLRETRLVAPFDGTVVEANGEAGEVVRAGQPVVQLSALDELEVEVGVPEAVRAKLTDDTPVKVHFPLAATHAVRGTIDQLGLGAAGQGHLFPVTVRLAATHAVAPGFTAEVVFDVAPGRATVVPVAAIKDPSGQSPYVFRVAAERAERVAVEVVRLLGDRVMVRSGLEVGDNVVVQGHIRLLAGDRVVAAQ